MTSTRTLRRLAAPAALALALVAVPACSNNDKTETGTGGTTVATGTSPQAEVRITDVWARTSPMSAKNGAVYAKLISTKDDKLVKASVDSSIAGKVELHEVTMADDHMTDGTAMPDDASMPGGMNGTSMAGGMSGNMVMKEVEAIELPAGETVELKPGSFHIMLLDLVKPLEAGQTFPVTFTFANAEPITIEATVREG